MLGFAEPKIKPKLKLKVDSDSIKYQERVRKLEASNNIVPFKDDNKIFRKLPPILFDYQQQFIEAALNRNYQCLVWEKSRRIGATHALAAYAVLEAAKGKRAKNFFYIGTSLPMARDFISSCAYWCKNFNLVAKFNDSPIIDKESDNILVLRITFNSGKRVEALSSKPESIRGRQGHVLVDEAAHIPNLKEFLTSCYAMQIWKCKVFVLSTHKGIDNEFNVFCESIKKDLDSKNNDGFYIQKTTFKQAIKDGFYKRVCLVDDIEYSEKLEQEYVRVIYAKCSSSSEEYDVIPSVTNVNAIFKPEYFKRIKKSELPTSWDVLGRFWDFAASDNPTSCYSVGTLVGIKNGKIYVLDWKYCRKNAGDSEDFYFSVTNEDGKKVISGVELEPGSMSMRYAEHLKRTLRGFTVKVVKPEGGKVQRSMPLKEAAKNGKLFIVDNEDWTGEYIKTICQFDGSKIPLITDSMDSLSGAYENFNRRINYMLIT